MKKLLFAFFIIAMTANCTGNKSSNNNCCNKEGSKCEKVDKKCCQQDRQCKKDSSACCANKEQHECQKECPNKKSGECPKNK